MERVDALNIDHVELDVRAVERSGALYARVPGAEVCHMWANAWMVRVGPIVRGLHSCPNGQLETFNAAQEFLSTDGIPFDGPKDTEVAWSLFITDPDGHRLESTMHHA